MRHSWIIARHVDIGSACVDIRLSPKSDVLVIIIIIIITLAAGSLVDAVFAAVCLSVCGYEYLKN